MKRFFKIGFLQALVGSRQIKPTSSDGINGEFQPAGGGIPPARGSFPRIELTYNRRVL
jgi:hypothetical protein